MDEFFEEENETADESVTVCCPHCDEQIYDDAEQCPYCLNYVTWDHSRKLSAMGKVVIWAMILALALPAIVALFNLF